MRDAAGQLADRVHALRMLHLRPEPAALLLDFPLLGHVARADHDAGFAVAPARRVGGPVKPAPAAVVCARARSTACAPAPPERRAHAAQRHGAVLGMQELRGVGAQQFDGAVAQQIADAGAEVGETAVGRSLEVELGAVLYEGAVALGRVRLRRRPALGADVPERPSDSGHAAAPRDDADGVVRPEHTAVGRDHPVRDLVVARDREVCGVPCVAAAVVRVCVARAEARIREPLLDRVPQNGSSRRVHEGHAVRAGVGIPQDRAARHLGGPGCRRLTRVRCPSRPRRRRRWPTRMERHSLPRRLICLGQISA